MIYSDIAIFALLFAVFFDLFIIKTQLLTRAAFWPSYAIILPFQLITNWWLTSRNIVMYNPDAIMGVRVASAPLEDLLFGFALVLSVMAMWVYWGRKGIQKK
jgi:lycopene cyclase domain-containing protein